MSWSRSDITVGSAFDPGTAAQLSKAYTERRPVFLAFVHSPSSNSKIGGRGIAQMSRAEILALAAANGIDHVCPDLQETLEPWEITLTRVHFKLPPIMTIAVRLRMGAGPSAATVSCVLDADQRRCRWRLATHPPGSASATDSWGAREPSGFRNRLAAESLVALSRTSARVRAREFGAFAAERRRRSCPSSLSTIRRTGRLKPSIPVSRSALAARPPQPGRMRSRMSRISMSPWGMCVLEIIRSLPQRSHMMRRNRPGHPLGKFRRSVAAGAAELPFRRA